MWFWCAEIYHCTNFHENIIFIIHHTEDNGPNTYLKVRADAGSMTQSLFRYVYCEFLLKLNITEIEFGLHSYYLCIRTLQRSKGIHSLTSDTLLPLDFLITVAVTCLHCCEGHRTISMISQCSHNFLTHLPLQLKCSVLGLCTRSQVPVVGLKSWQN